MRVGTRRGLIIVVFLSLAGSLYVLTSRWVRNRSSLCHLAARSQLASECAVRSEGMLYGSSRGPLMLNGEECGLRSDAWATVEIDRSAQLNNDTRIVLDRLMAPVPDGATTRVRVLVTGYIEDLGHPCFAPRFRIRASKIEPTSTIDVVRIDDVLRGYSVTDSKAMSRTH
jgi:hypothetical protein